MARLPRFQPLGWDYYSIGPEWNASRDDLVRAVRKASKAANQRLRKLEKAGQTEYAYKRAMSQLGDRTRFKERTAKMSLADLKKEYAMLRDFLSSKTSTLTGIEEVHDKRYETAKQAGFKGTRSEWDALVKKAFDKKVVQLFSSSLIYRELTESSNDGSLIQEIIAMAETEKSAGQALLEYSAKAAARRARKGADT